MLERRYLAAVVGTGAASGGAAALPGIGTAASVATGAAEIAAFVSTTALYVLALAEVYGVPTDDPQFRRALVLTVLLGELGEAALAGADIEASTGPECSAGTSNKDTAKFLDSRVIPRCSSPGSGPGRAPCRRPGAAVRYRRRRRRGRERRARPQRDPLRPARLRAAAGTVPGARGRHRARRLRAPPPTSVRTRAATPARGGGAQVGRVHVHARYAAFRRRPDRQCRGGVLDRATGHRPVRRLRRRPGLLPGADRALPRRGRGDSRRQRGAGRVRTSPVWSWASSSRVADPVVQSIRSGRRGGVARRSPPPRGHPRGGTQRPRFALRPGVAEHRRRQPRSDGWAAGLAPVAVLPRLRRRARRAARARPRLVVRQISVRSRAGDHRGVPGGRAEPDRGVPDPPGHEARWAVLGVASACSPPAGYRLRRRRRAAHPGRRP